MFAKSLLFFVLLFSALDIMKASSDSVPTWELQDSGVSVNLRGLSVASPTVAWASGVNGTIVRTTDGGTTWKELPKIKHDGKEVLVDFRDIEAFGENSAVVMGVASPSYICKTLDGGQTWTIGYYSEDPDIFLDAFDFWDVDNGIAFGDAIKGKLLILRTFDGGATWSELPDEQRPQVLEGQGGFAASGTCLVTQDENSVFIGLGGAESTVLYSTDRGYTWAKTVAPIQSGDASSGINSFAFKNSLEGVVTGGNYNGDNSTVRGQNFAITNDGGKTWKNLEPEQSPSGYRSCITYLDNLILAVGGQSCDYADESGIFKEMSGNFFTVKVSKYGKSGAVAFASGPTGKIAKLNFVPTE